MASYRELAGALGAICRAIRHRTISETSVLLTHCEALLAAAAKGDLRESPWTPFAAAEHGDLSETVLRKAAHRMGVPFREAQAIMADEIANTRVYANSRYQVVVRANGSTVYLSIKRLDQLPIRNWRDLQRIKNELVGPECEGFEIFPAESRLVDTANQYHLWVFTDPEIRLPFGFDGGRNVLGDIDIGEGQAPLGFGP